VIVAQLGALDVEAALIGIDRDGAVLMTYSQTGLLRGYTTDTDEPIAAAYEGTMGTARRSTAQ
jgi:isoaspartyl peptidase/L-asparaginase-like protein (Ntn-hydrolase superfamily)